jgi:hypothetical protein
MLPFRYIPDSWLTADRIPGLCFYQVVRKQLQFKHLTRPAPNSKQDSHWIIIPNPNNMSEWRILLYNTGLRSGERKRECLGTFDQCIRLHKAACLRITSRGTGNEICSCRIILLTYQPTRRRGERSRHTEPAAYATIGKLGANRSAEFCASALPAAAIRKRENSIFVGRSESLWEQNRRRKR